MTTTTGARLTWDRLVQARPALAEALHIVRHLRPVDGHFCANCAFYRVLKPIVSKAVGWGAERDCPFAERSSAAGAQTSPSITPTPVGRPGAGRRGCAPAPPPTWPTRRSTTRCRGCRCL